MSCLATACQLTRLGCCGFACPSCICSTWYGMSTSSDAVQVQCPKGQDWGKQSSDLQQQARTGLPYRFLFIVQSLLNSICYILFIAQYNLQLYEHHAEHTGNKRQQQMHTFSTAKECRATLCNNKGRNMPWMAGTASLVICQLSRSTWYAHGWTKSLSVGCPAESQRQTM